MDLFIGGGCGEHGRNCFYFSDGYHGIIVDCGIMAGASAPYPRLTPNQIRHASHLLLTHSHGDHTGALPWLLQQGFQGTIIMTTPTWEQLSCHSIPNKIILLDETALPLQTMLLTEYLSLTWGRSGHCPGSCWYKIGYGDKNIFCSGDYIADSLCYACDEITDYTADLAILDAAYSPCTLTAPTMRAAFFRKVEELLAERDILLLPVPKYGRGLEMLLALKPLLVKHPAHGDSHFLKQLQKLYAFSDWLLPKALQQLQSIDVKGFAYTEDLHPGIYFLSDPQLKRPENYQLVRQLGNNGHTLCSGHLEANSNAERLAAQGLLQQCYYPIHGTDSQVQALQEQNNFSKIILNHSAKLPSVEKVEF
ncbi:MBL fold metallo-hydrolase [Phascolarctobacterium sp.]|uniref:MBL fold metallo-hydrolase n=1 Tax=Phascolarctobacterium sp. TaxID=2049039 RepID=UPI00386B67F0